MPCGREIRLRRVKSLRRWGIYFISLDAKRQISQFAEQIISPWAKRTISLFIWIKRFEYWARSVSRFGAPRCLRQMKRCSEQEETTSIAKRSSSSVAPYHSFPPLAKTHSLRTSSSPQNASILGHPPARRLCFWPTGSLISIHLRCMKKWSRFANEVQSNRIKKQEVHFTLCEHSERFMTTKLSLCVCGANTSFIEISLY